jgi:hypothetical protein
MMPGAPLLLLIGMLAVTSSVDAQATSAFAAALDGQWDFGKPAVSEQRFRTELAKWPAESAEAQEIRTQIARTLGLQRKFDEAHAVLDGVEAKLPALPLHVRVRYLLERGRTQNSSGAPGYRWNAPPHSRSCAARADTCVARMIRLSMGASGALLIALKPWPMCRHITTCSSDTARKNGSQ